jgi:hypothetical protein
MSRLSDLFKRGVSRPRDDVCVLCEIRKAKKKTKAPCGKVEIRVCERCQLDIRRDQHAWQAWDDWISGGGKGTMLGEKEV